MNPETIDVQIRQWAVDQIITNSPGGTKWVDMMAYADILAQYVLTGNVPSQATK